MILHSGSQSIAIQPKTYNTIPAKAVTETLAKQALQSSSPSGKLEHGGDTLIPHVEENAEFAKKWRKTPRTHPTNH
ncbi:hypothetical protein [Pseudoalteromonas luteoviolacea]|uniref:Uncharacterized protein n=1 Tax=Pseudoalteromonas luteoviolacea H33 TaxID=1365251 RepID=A0A167DP01_9GAMM|nr:hypothetical protein [Pseudoalteromonas luteoviolacea]KZN49143.1 hypothetical protein N476_20100 [Pseudoalteromonas luteoviolacea H33]KZN73573.1 hypothetical protein N477_23000 [Pseudoalteromonas luteoviolacea H33-S]MBQ4875581.1 hypothetical protein [Pseudoalteromonas luteoviolacea]MBQ4904616.1 hypothetical protein [Pseudoalteromonas luteoviolacea]